MSDPTFQTQTCLLERMRVITHLRQGDYASAERIRHEIARAAEHLTRVIEDHKARYNNDEALQ